MELSTLDAISYFSRAIVLKQKQPGNFVNGRWVAGATVDVYIRGTLQPTTAEDLEILPEGSRKSGLVTLYTKSEIRIAGDTLNTESDLIVVSGKTYKALQAHDRTFLGGYYKIILEQVEINDD